MTAFTQTQVSTLATLHERSRRSRATGRRDLWLAAAAAALLAGMLVALARPLDPQALPDEPAPSVLID